MRKFFCDDFVLIKTIRIFASSDKDSGTPNGQTHMTLVDLMLSFILFCFCPSPRKVAGFFLHVSRDDIWISREFFYIKTI